MTLFVMLIWTFLLPLTVEAFSGTPERKFERDFGRGDRAKQMGLLYGMHTIWIWYIPLLIRRLKPLKDHEIT